MALIKCTGCGHPVSSRARSCPKCGSPGSNQVVALETTQVPAPAEVQLDSVATSSVAHQAATPPGHLEAGMDGTTGDQEDAGVEQDIEIEAPPQAGAAPETEAGSHAWHYIGASGRQGPATLSMIRALVACGELPPETPIWQSGMADWVALSQYHDQNGTSLTETAASEPSVVPEKRSGGALVWALALSPLWGGLVQITVTELWVALTHNKLAYYAQMWWIVVALNVGASYLDFHSFRKSGADTGQIGKWLGLLVPAYLYRRDKIAGANLTRVVVWSGSLLLWLATFSLLNSIYAKMALK